jgi:hypothetical protein
MIRHVWKAGMLAIVILAACSRAVQVSSGGEVTAATQPSWAAVEAAIGRSGAAQPADVYRFNFPRSDLRVMVGDVQVRPALALGGWVAFKQVSGGAMIAGDLVLTEDEVNPVISALQAGGVEQTAVHHHILGETPRIIYVHVHAHGDAVKIAQAIRNAVAATKIPAPPSGPAATPPAITIDTAQVARILRNPGRANGGVFQFSIPRSEAIRDMGMEVPPSMGLGTAINFQPTGGGKAAITGDFVMVASEVNPVIRTLRENGINVTSLHSHMLTEEPRLFFMHFWANDDAVKLATAMRAALDKMASR